MNVAGTVSCGVCQHKEVQAIDFQLMSGVPVRTVSVRYGIPRSTLGDHRVRCLKKESTVVEVMPDLQVDAVQGQDSAARLKPVDALTHALMSHIASGMKQGRMPSISLIRTWISATELALKAQLVLEEREPPGPKGQTYKGKMYRFGEGDYPDMPVEERAAMIRTLTTRYLAGLPPDSLAGILSDVQGLKDATAAGNALQEASLRAAQEQGRLSHAVAERVGDTPEPVVPEHLIDSSDVSQNNVIPFETEEQRIARIRAQIARDFGDENVIARKGFSDSW